MVCKVDGCDREEAYKKDMVCQMHYFRMMRTGTYEKRKLKNTRTHSNGYVLVKDDNHPLSKRRKDKLIYQHRYVFYNHNNGFIESCEYCSNDLTWDNAHIDHIDENRTNNDISNLRALCAACNTLRTKIRKCDSKHKIEFNGEVKNVWDWGKDKRVKITPYNIIKRIERGWSVEDALFKPSLTKKRELKPRKTNKDIVKERESLICK